MSGTASGIAAICLGLLGIWSAINAWRGKSKGWRKVLPGRSFTWIGALGAGLVVVGAAATLAGAGARSLAQVLAYASMGPIGFGFYLLFFDPAWAAPRSRPARTKDQAPP
jgi:small-conductance mechanosensitive channel